MINSFTISSDSQKGNAPTDICLIRTIKRAEVCNGWKRPGNPTTAWKVDAYVHIQGNTIYIVMRLKEF